MNEKQLKKTFSYMQIKDDMKQRLMDNCNPGNEKNIMEWRTIKMKKFNKTTVSPSIASSSVSRSIFAS